MAIDYSRSAFPKGTPKKLAAEAKAAAVATKDKAESAKARKRAGGLCEVLELDCTSRLWRCVRKDTQTHHLIGGIGRRNRGEKSILAAYKLRVCNSCHSDITGKILRPTTAVHDAATVRFWRARAEKRVQ